MDEVSRAKMRYSFEQRLEELMLDKSLMEELDRVYLPLANMIMVSMASEQSMRVIGINGAQGAGKTTFGELMKIVLEQGFGLKTLILSIDDLYLSRADREKMAKTVHPLFITRGVPGTHNVKQGIDLLENLSSATPEQQTLIPRFDKSTDNPYPKEKWDIFYGRPDVVLFDGWFMGADEQPISELVNPINELEAEQDKDAVWRTYVNLQLGTTYKQLFDKIDLLVMLQVPSFEKVYEWRTLQEQKLRIKTAGQKDSKVMNDEEVRHFILHYERLTRWILKELPSKADMVFKVNDSHQICI